MLDDIRNGKYNNPIQEITDKESRKLYQIEDEKLYLQFKEDLIKEFGLENYPKKEQVFYKAWQDGHSTGYETVYWEMHELVGLLIL